MLDRVAEFFIFGFAPMIVVMLAAPERSSGEDSPPARPDETKPNDAARETSRRRHRR
jgi:hypothetical protein